MDLIPDSEILLDVVEVDEKKGVFLYKEFDVVKNAHVDGTIKEAKTEDVLITAARPGKFLIELDPVEGQEGQKYSHLF